MGFHRGLGRVWSNLPRKNSRRTCAGGLGFELEGLHGVLGGLSFRGSGPRGFMVQGAPIIM